MAKKKKDDDEELFYEGLGNLSEALSVKDEAEDPLKSIGRIASAVELGVKTWMKVRVRNQNQAKKEKEVETPEGSSLNDLNRYYNILNDKNNITDFYGKDSDVNLNYFREAAALNLEDPTQSLLSKNFQVNMSSMSGIIENTSNEAFTAQYQEKYADMVKQAGEQKEATIPQNKPSNVEALPTPKNLADQITSSSTKTKTEDPEKLKEDQNTATEETDTKVEETELPPQDQADNVVIEEPVTTDAPVEDTTEYFEDPDKKKPLNFFGGMR